ncbi:FIST N-terminal domain-containing protein [Undibacterium sp. RTI2.1]|uniref:FIST signal transduction protein n=1 Tax=unclassified Undibacterium TaxID=2630295 RepID=UPI002AB55CE7|nr:MULTISPECIES: FIST N-terminal domain-containing protein [unclassified Undibacterium]MDY7537070.1 FIST N-terminal domain-containing protein [Undibacterium sp. 5I1]MEB0029891.1 FIST N-terminal domain-containing protein [Undibacterium sp. RTI2.1]MEB0115176.1 FIST N-terminal domain-containing protein [Undibacterium sp. RTI2.2]MEB0229248.1 FIST N-terminal domain-containing protein [Undibacterium sp. 10I3]MEB0256204.1 FIST N-terminal domain-containing protein [Undibacterium sp. 5I1]
MKTQQVVVKLDSDFEKILSTIFDDAPDLVLVFGAVPFFTSANFPPSVKKRFPEAIILGCSTAGEIAVDRVYDDIVALTTVKFSNTTLRSVSTPITNMADSFDAGARLSTLLPADDLAGILVFGTGVSINGSALVAGLQSVLAPNIPISGGLAADAGAFQQTWTWGESGVADNQIVAVGLYGKSIQLSYGTFAGWEPFGPARKVTRCAENVLFELDGERALDVYKRYLGDYAKDLPGSGLLFPFEMLGKNRDKSGIFRTILGIDEVDGSLTLAGDIDANGYLRLMHSSTDKLIEGAETAATTALTLAKQVGSESLAILVSCIGRKLVMGDRVDEEVEAVADILGKNTTITGFYSNGEIAGTDFHGECRLHNQTMTITWINEIESNLK